MTSPNQTTNRVPHDVPSEAPGIVGVIPPTPHRAHPQAPHHAHPRPTHWLSSPKGICFSLLLLLLTLTAQAQIDSPETRAMRDELARSTKDLHLDTNPTPYYISYRITDTTTQSAAASFGALTASAQNRTRTLAVTVRLGDYAFDSSNAPATGNGLVALIGALTSSATPLPLDDSYEELRRRIWLATDAAYKKAVEDLSAKKAARAGRTATSDPIPDFSKEPARTESETLPPVSLPQPEAERIVRASSAVFRSLASVENATASLTVINTTERFLNSEGTSYLREIPAVDFRSAASVQNKTAEIFSDSYSAYGRSLAELPPEATLVSESKAVADRLTLRLRGKVAKKYNGPVLLFGDASAELFSRSFGSLLSSQRGTGNSLTALLGAGQGSLAGKIGSRVLPDYLSVTDNPLLSTLEGHPLFGNYKFDEDGVPAQEVVLVKDGVLKRLLTGRTPARGMLVSTGSQRRHGVLPGNLFVASSKSVTRDALKAQLLDLVKARSLEYGYIVRSLSGNVAVECTRIFPDGHEEPVRNARLAEISAGTFKDVLAVSADRTFYTTRAGGASLEGLAPGGDDLVTYVVPDMLFEDMLVEHVNNDHPKLPAEPNPIAAN